MKNCSKPSTSLKPENKKKRKVMAPKNPDEEGNTEMKVVKPDDEEIKAKSTNKRGGDEEIKSFKSALENAASLLEEVDMNQDFERFILYGRNFRWFEKN